MVITFGVDEAFEHLKEYGYVATYRSRRRKRPNCETWCSRGRGESKEFNVRVTEIGQIDPDPERLDHVRNLTKLGKVSGFDGGYNWIRAIEELHGEVPEEGYIYMVTRID